VIDAVIDTGFTAFLTLPSAVIAELGLHWQTSDRGMLADGTEYLFDMYEAKVEWDGKVRRIPVIESDADPLVGMRLMRGYELKMHVRSNGIIAIKRLVKRPGR
jgi:clan AA aspartic protease